MAYADRVVSLMLIKKCQELEIDTTLIGGPNQW